MPPDQLPNNHRELLKFSSTVVEQLLITIINFSMTFLEVLENTASQASSLITTDLANFDMDTKNRKETVVTYDFTEDPIPPNHCCCGRVKVQVSFYCIKYRNRTAHKFFQRGCKVVAVFSLLAVLANGILYFLGISRLGTLNP
uniref:Immediate early response 3-interacting protein 1 n=1 Tax=Heterorhabditis bacteriophora TaxID=37862 RepID=A0A1I7WSJ9_HETBA